MSYLVTHVRYNHRSTRSPENIIAYKYADGEEVDAETMLHRTRKNPHLSYVRIPYGKVIRLRVSGRAGKKHIRDGVGKQGFSMLLALPEF